MQVDVVLYPGFTASDMVGPFEVLALPITEMVFAAEHAGAFVLGITNSIFGALLFSGQL